MYLFKTIDALREYLDFQRPFGHSIGLVPTMGALHDGHLSLVRHAIKDCDCTVASVFVNPTQFNEAEDLQKYPRTPDKDIEMLLKVGCDVLFMPPVEEIYPENAPKPTVVDYGLLTKVMEGQFREGHFEGVVQVVERLLRLVQANRIYMGQKDYQQFQIIRHMAEAIDMEVEVVGVPIVREEDGLAMSSRNVRLSAEDRQKAPLIYQTLQKAKSMISTHKARDIEEWAMQVFKDAGFRPEYFELVNGKTLESINLFDSMPIIACTAVWVGEVRLIDNLKLK